MEQTSNTTITFTDDSESCGLFNTQNEEEARNRIGHTVNRSKVNFCSLGGNKNPTYIAEDQANIALENKCF